MVQVPDSISCVECGAECRRLSHAPPEGFEDGDVVAYRCVECGDRFDLVMTAEGVEDD